MAPAHGPLKGLRVLALGGVGAVPFTCMLLADMGADVVRIERQSGYDGGAPVAPRFNLLNRGQRSVGLDLKHPAGSATAVRLASEAEIVVEGFRPGVAERLGVGPDDCLEANPALVYGRLTGWGQTGPRAADPGHDLNYVGLTGVVHAIGPAGGPPVIPLNLAGDLGGGAMYLIAGVLAALLEARSSGKGQVVDAAMVDGSASLMTLFYGLAAAGYWVDRRGSNRLDSGAPWYHVYETSDGQWVSIAAGEARFWRNLLDLLEIPVSEVGEQHDRSKWPEVRDRIAAVMRTRTRAEWVRAAEGRDACLAPVLSLSEAPVDPHLAQRETFVEIDGIVQPAPAPRFSRTPGGTPRPPAAAPGADTDEALSDWGLSTDELTHLRIEGAIT